MTPQELKASILQLAIQGKLVEQRPEEGTGEEGEGREKSTESQEAEEAEGAGQYTAASEKASGADYGHGGVFPRTCAGGNESVRIYPELQQCQAGV